MYQVSSYKSPRAFCRERPGISPGIPLRLPHRISSSFFLRVPSEILLGILLGNSSIASMISHGIQEFSRFFLLISPEVVQEFLSAFSPSKSFPWDSSKNSFSDRSWVFSCDSCRILWRISSALFTENPTGIPLKNLSLYSHGFLQRFLPELFPRQHQGFMQDSFWIFSRSSLRDSLRNSSGIPLLIIPRFLSGFSWDSYYYSIGDPSRDSFLFRSLFRDFSWNSSRDFFLPPGSLQGFIH